MVRGFLLFSGIPEKDCHRIVAPTQLRRYDRGTTIFYEGEPVREVVLLTSGCIKLSQVGLSGQEVILQLVGTGESTSTEGFSTSAHRSTARTVEASSALVWDAQQFDAVAQNCPALRRNISLALQRVLDQLEERYLEVSTENVASRLSSQIVRLLSQVGKQSNGQVEIALSQRDLAQMTGTTLFTVSRLLCQWEDQGVVRSRRGTVMVLNVPALVGLRYLNNRVCRRPASQE